MSVSMLAIRRTVNTPTYVPDYIATSIETIDFALLKKRGINYVAFDADSTLVPYRGVQLSDSTTKFLREQKKQFKGWCIASNRVTNDLDEIARAMDVPVIRGSAWVRKPKKLFFKRVLALMGARADETVMVGDKLIADMWGAKRYGLTTVWVEHLGRDGLADRITQLRRLEKLLLRRFLPGRGAKVK